jgi:hypothetical protein
MLQLRQGEKHEHNGQRQNGDRQDNREPDQFALSA